MLLGDRPNRLAHVCAHARAAKIPRRFDLTIDVDPVVVDGSEGEIEVDETTTVQTGQMILGGGELGRPVDLVGIPALSAVGRGRSADSAERAEGLLDGAPSTAALRRLRTSTGGARRDREGAHARRAGRPQDPARFAF